MLELFPDDPHKRSVTATAQPSLIIPRQTGIYVAVNDNYELKEQTGEAAANLLVDKFEPSIRRAEWIVDQIMKLKVYGHV